MLLPLTAGHAGDLASTRSLALVLWTGAAGKAVAYALFVAGLARTTAAAAGTLSLAEPLAAAALGFVVLGKAVDAPVAAGCALLLVGLATATVPARPRTRAEAAGDEPPAPLSLDGEGSDIVAHRSGR